MVYRKLPPPVRVPETGCLLYQGKLQPNGYPSGAHRKAYVKAYGPIPAGHIIDHVWDRGCRFKHCIEPTHLEAITQRENVQRYYDQVERSRFCNDGHEYTPENTRWRGTDRICKLCQQRYRRDHYVRTGK